MAFRSGEFTPIDSQAQLSYRKKSPTLGYLYPVEKEALVVARPPEQPQQYILGPLDSVVTVLKAFNILDSFGLGSARQMNVTLAGQILSNKRGLNPHITAQIPELHKQFNIDGHIPDGDYSTGVIGCFDRHPHYYGTHDERWLNFDAFVYTVLQAAILVEELAHIHQYQEGLNAGSLWKERTAGARRLQFCTDVLNSGRLTNRQEKGLLTLTRHLSNMIFEYRNARGYEDHIPSKKHLQGTAHKDTAFNDDIQFGY